MKKLLAVLAAVLLMSTAALAANPHFINTKTTCTVDRNGGLVVSFKESGLGDAETTYALEATAEVTCQCVNRGGKCPQAANKVTSVTEVTAVGTFSPKNGTVVATLVIPAPGCPASEQPTCGTGQVLKFSGVTYSDIVLTDITNDVPADDLPDNLAVTLFNCP